VGQQLTATLNIGDYMLQTGDAASWTVSDGNPFASYDPKLDKNQLTTWASPNAFQTTMHFAGGGSASSLPCQISCTVTIQTYPPFTVTLPSISQPIIWTPASTMVPAVGYDKIVTPNFGLYGLSDGDGIDFKTSVTEPEPTQFSGNGTYVFAQLITPNHTIYSTINGIDETGTLLNSGKEGLDNAFPYPFPGTSYPCNGLYYTSQDFPGVPLTRYPVETKVTGNDTAKMYIMYMPPGTGSNYVPLLYDPWSWGGTAEFDGSNWSITINTAPSGGSLTPTCVHPQWSLIHYNADPYNFN